MKSKKNKYGLYTKLIIVKMRSEQHIILTVKMRSGTIPDTRNLWYIVYQDKVDSEIERNQIFTEIPTRLNSKERI